MKDFEKLLSSGDPNQFTASFFEEMARDKFKDFLEFFRKDYFGKIDFTKDCVFLDEEMPHFLPAEYTVRQDAFNLFVKAHLKDGNVSYFLIHAIFAMERGEIQVGIADVPHELIDIYYRSRDNVDNKNRVDNKKHEYTDDNQCSNCGRTDIPLTITINAATMKKMTICSVCMYNGGPSGQSKRKSSLKQLDKDIADYEKLAKQYEKLIQETPETPELPSAISKYAMTPLSNYKSIQAILAELRSQRMAALTNMESETRLKYELKKSIDAEDYAQSATIRDKLNNKKNKKGK